MLRKCFKQSSLDRIQRAISHGNADTEANLKSVAQVDVAQVTTLNRQTVGFSDGLARGHKIAAQAVAQRRGQVAWRWYLGVNSSGLHRVASWWMPLRLSLLLHINAFAL
jgi:hypothetical protein